MQAVYAWNHLFSILDLLQFWFQNSRVVRTKVHKGCLLVLCGCPSLNWNSFTTAHANRVDIFQNERQLTFLKSRLYLQIFRANRSCGHEFSLPWFRRETLIASKWFKASLTRLLVSWKVFARCCWSSTYSSWLHLTNKRNTTRMHAATTKTAARTFAVPRLRSTRSYTGPAFISHTFAHPNSTGKKDSAGQIGCLQTSNMHLMNR